MKYIFLLLVCILSSCAPENEQEGDLLTADWSSIEQEARGSDLYWYMWGGSTVINDFVKGYIGEKLKADYDITLHIVPVTDTALAVAEIEVSAAAGRQGQVDMLWVNGENFRTLREQDLLFGPYAEKLPNMRYVDTDSPAIINDFGYPVQGYESPYGAAQFAFLYDSAKVGSPPQDMAALLEWIIAHPGRFTYPAIPDFVGSAFIRHVMYHVAGDSLSGAFDPVLFDEIAPRAWDILNQIKPYLWREGASYPETSAQLELLYANGEVYFDLTYHPNDAGTYVDQGRYSPTTRAYALDSGTIGNIHFVAIASNAAHKAAAMVAANVILDPQMQWEKSRVWGDFPAIDIQRLSPEWQRRFADLERHPSNVAPEELTLRRLPEPTTDWLDAIEKGWVEQVLTQ